MKNFKIGDALLAPPIQRLKWACAINCGIAIKEDKWPIYFVLVGRNTQLCKYVCC